jgi:DNA polymerase III epsilon subunit-like protein
MFLDVETTGLPRQRNASYTNIDNWPRIVSISWALHEADEAAVEHRYSVIKPNGFSIPADSARIHGITDEYARAHGRPIAGVLKQLNADLDRYHPSLAVAHNIDFDRNVLLAETLRAKQGSSLSELPWFCTMQATVDLCALPRNGRSYKWPKLEELYHRLFGEALENAHDASVDVMACARCYFELKRRYGIGNGNGSGNRFDEQESDGNADHAQDLIDRILCWADDHDWFDTGFVESLQASLDEYGSLTDRQLGALENIVARWGID